LRGDWGIGRCGVGCPRLRWPAEGHARVPAGVGDTKALGGTWQGARADVAGDARRGALAARTTPARGDLGDGAGRIAAMCARGSATCEPVDTGRMAAEAGKEPGEVRGDVRVMSRRGRRRAQVAGAAGDQPAGWPRLVEAGARRLDPRRKAEAPAVGGVVACEGLRIWLKYVGPRPVLRG
jgi:hypothetical protein